MASYGNNVYVIWENTPENNGQIFFIRSTDGGYKFSNPVNLGNNTGFLGVPRIGIFENNYVYVVWHDASHDILFRRSSNGGDTFDKTINLSNNNTIQSFSPQITVSAVNNVYVAWTETYYNIQRKLPSYDIILKKSMNKGVTFEHDRVDSINKGTGFVEHLRLAASGNNVYALWVNGTIVPGNYHDLTDIVFTKSIDFGNGFAKVINISN